MASRSDLVFLDKMNDTNSSIYIPQVVQPPTMSPKSDSLYEQATLLTRSIDGIKDQDPTSVGRFRPQHVRSVGKERM